MEVQQKYLKKTGLIALIAVILLWWGSFSLWLLAIIALLCLVAVAFLQETLPSEERESISVLKSLGGLIIIYLY